MKLSFQLAVSFLFAPTVVYASGMEITPFRTFNLQPTLQYGIPFDSSTAVTPRGRLNVALVEDLASFYTVDQSGNEQLVFDGESSKTTLALRYGISDRVDAGITIPYLHYGGGFLDSFIIHWHDAFGMKQGGRDSAPTGAINLGYQRDGREKLKMKRSVSGVGDVRVTAGMALYNDVETDSRTSVALKGEVKLPTGDPAELTGSGSTDLALSIGGSLNSATGWGTFGLFGSIGALAMTDGRLIAGQQNNLGGFGTIGGGWGPTSWISFKIQLNGATPLYTHSALPELSGSSLVLVTGGALLFPGDYQLDIGVSEDITVGTAPDVAFHLGLSKLY
jgi:hypothetical protein